MYGFDLVEWLRGNVARSVSAVMALLRGLPDECSFKAHWFATLKMRGGEEPPDTRSADQKRFDEVMGEFELWSAQNKVLAQVGNAVHLNTMVAGRLKDGKELPFLGPSAWRESSEVESKSAGSVAGFYQMVTGAPLPG